MKFIQVAGTNAKGSVCTYAAEILTRAGYRCGLFTSPHLIRREERIRIDGEEIPTRELDRLMRENPGKTLFHTYLNACMKWFAENGVQVAVMETGLGGLIAPVSELPVDPWYNRLFLLQPQPLSLRIPFLPKPFLPLLSAIPPE